MRNFSTLDSNSKILRDVKIHASKPHLLACRSSNRKDELHSMKTKLFAMQKIDFLSDTGLRVLRTQMPEQIPAEKRTGHAGKGVDIDTVDEEDVAEVDKLLEVVGVVSITEIGGGVRFLW
ncbi:hypothetical protein TNCV_4652221 [Trichonephila clavipes]|nr:hypothetical protein TNCV_4652221 [Trichonephila clavipes]